MYIAGRPRHAIMNAVREMVRAACGSRDKQAAGAEISSWHKQQTQLSTSSGTQSRTSRATMNTSPSTLLLPENHTVPPQPDAAMLSESICPARRGVKPP